MPEPIHERLADICEGAKPIEKLHPQLLESSQLRTKLENILTPSFQEIVWKDMSHADMQDRCGALCEWISMAQLQSSRISAEDSVDPYLSRYTIPDYNGSNAVNLISLKWHGLISSSWTMQLFLNLLLVNHGPNLRGVLRLPRYQKANLYTKCVTAVLNQESPIRSARRWPGLFFPRQR